MKKTPVLFMVALIADFSYPKTFEILKKLSKSKEKIALYTIHVKKFPSVCEHAAENFVRSEHLNSWLKCDVDPKGQVPIQKILKKIAFDIKFDLHQINEVIVSTDLPEVDSCGKDVCGSFADLEEVVKNLNRTLIIHSLSEKKCDAFKNHSLDFKVASTPAILIANRKLFPSTKIASTADSSSAAGRTASESETPSPSISPKQAKMKSQTTDGVGKTKVEFQGPPLKLVLKNESEEVKVDVPGTVEIQAGSWKVETTYPDWLKGIQFQIDTQKLQTSQIDLKVALQDQIEWVESSPKIDQMLRSFFPKKMSIFVPKKSPPVPLPLNFKYILEPTE